MLRNLKAGALADLKQPSGPQGIILGDKLAARLGAKLGHPVNVISPQGGDLTPLGLRPRNERFRVVGVFSSGFYELDSAWAYISLESAQRLLNVEDVVNNIELKLDDIYAAPEVARAAEAVIGPKLGATTWMEQNKHIFGALNMERTVTFVTIGLIVLVAALNILITLVMMVMEKHKDIAILVSMGASRAAIMRIFVLQGTLIGAAGTITGGVLGWAACRVLDRFKLIQVPVDVYQIAYVPFTLLPGDAAVVLGGAVLICFLATIHPARGAAKLDPAEALRYE
jgi:lipoprotein-releasing system permease protein